MLNASRKLIMKAAISLGAPLVFFVAACSGKTTDNPDGGGGDGGSSSCPATMPASGGACTPEGRVCEYGDDPRPSCRSTTTCTNGAWVIAVAGCPPPPPTTCPATREAAQGQACTPVDAFCSYAGLACHCTNCTDGPVSQCTGALTWHCDSPNPDPACPPALPNLGTSCGTQGQECDYGCGTDASRHCNGGVWTKGTPSPCPVSTRRVKRDIQYLSTDGLEKLAHELSALRLATYEYTDPALAGRRRLGFILEDNPPSVAVDAEKNQIELYGYTSLVAATVQHQEKQIEEMRREMADMRREIERLRAHEK